ncbi:MAG: PAS domain S-box protein, partial [Proteobacteria bacterium]|nr:PAS domain S-box protein [Pseudomonadota bacterium]
MAEETAKPKGRNPGGEKKDRKGDGGRILKFDLFHKYFSITLTSLTLFVLVVGYLAWHVERFNIVKTSVVDYYGLLILAEQDLQREIWVLTTDTLQISYVHRHTFEENAGKNSNLPALEEDFMSLAGLKPFYVQISMLDMDGKEIVRVNNNNGNPLIVSQETLQDKSGQAYYQKALSLEKDTYYLSGLILNEEFGQVERPLKPVIQAAAPLVDANGARIGVVVITYDATILLSDLKKRLSGTKGVFHIVRPNGSWVIAPKGKQLWADQLGHGQTFDLEYGSVWPEFLAKPSGVAVSGNTAFAFSRISLRTPISAVSPQFIPQTGVAESASNDLIFILVVQTPALFAWILENEQAFTAGAGSILILVSLISLGVSYPLSIRQQEQARRKKDEAYFQAITDTMVDGLIVIDAKGSIQSINKTGLEIFGYTEPELINRNITILMRKNDAMQCEKYLKNYLAGSESNTISKPLREVVGRHKNGKSIDLELAVAELRSDEQTFLIGSLRDVTEKKQTEAAVKEAESRLKMLADNASDIIVLHGKKGEITYITPALKKHLGINPGEVIGKQTIGTVHPEDKKDLAKNWNQRVLKEGKSFYKDVRFRNKKGEYLWFECHTQPIKDEKGEVIAAVTTSRNITEYKKAESEALRLGRIVEESLNEIYTFDVKTLKFLSVNRGARENLGYSLKELQGMTPLDIKPEYTRKSFSELVKPLQTGEKNSIQFETLHKRKDGTTYDVEVFLQLSKTGVEPVVVAIIEDITDKKAAAENLRQAQKMEAVGNLSGGIAHDFNNILTAIQGSLQLLEMVETDISDDARECLGIAIKSTKRGADLTHRLLAFSRKQTLKPKVVEVSELVRGMIPMLRRTIDESIEIETHLMEQEALVTVDESELENSLLNLTVNARDAMPDGGHLIFEVKEVEVKKTKAGEREIDPGTYIVISVSDTGLGMPPDVCDRVFEPFFTTKGMERGTGLGLSMVYGFVKQSGGHITVYSEVGKGTTFKLYLKATGARKKPRPDKKTTLDLKVKGTGTILLVEDDEGVRQFITQALSVKGYTVLDVGDGPSALLVMEGDKGDSIDLLLTDVVLPKGMSGPEIGKEFEKRYPGKPIIYSSGYTGKAIERNGVLKEGEELLSKPYDLEVLFEWVHEKLN